MQSKTCQSCRRSLPVSYFNISHTTSDKYRKRCKECTSCYYKMSYRKRAPENAPCHSVPFDIIPLRLHNTELLKAQFASLENRAYGADSEIVLFSLNGTDVQTRGMYQLTITQLDQMYGFELWGAYAHSPTEKYYCSVGEDFIQAVGDLLFKRNIRLHLGLECDIILI